MVLNVEIMQRKEDFDESIEFHFFDEEEAIAFTMTALRHMSNGSALIKVREKVQDED